MTFRPSILLTAVLVTLTVLFGRMGFWQLERQQEKQALFERFENAPVMDIEKALAQKKRFARVEATGRYDTDRHILLDNRMLNGRPGVHVLTPFHLPSGVTLLVNRGWLPLAADRRSLPAVPTEAGQQFIRGILNKPSSGGPKLGAADKLDTERWPQLVTYLELNAVSNALDQPLAPWILQLDQADPGGFGDRQWQPAVMEPATHGAYAVQWFALATTALIIWAVLGIRRGRLLKKGPLGQHED
ncbi:MAG: SURF1 family protein [Xanthomonadales bacterium]|nr:SURF1 family protein [Xanthomonadales bacterium]